MSLITYPTDVTYLGDGGGGADAAYSPSTQSLLTTPASPDRYADVGNRIAGATNLAIGTYYYPGASGFAVFGFPGFLGFGGQIVAGVGTTVTMIIAGSYDPTYTLWHPITEVFTLNDNSVGNASIIVGPSTSLLFSLHVEPVPFRFCRLAVTVSGGASNSVTIDTLQRP
jgi:hypothetical protein